MSKREKLQTTLFSLNYLLLYNIMIKLVLDIRNIIMLYRLFKVLRSPINAPWYVCDNNNIYRNSNISQVENVIQVVVNGT